MSKPEIKKEQIDEKFTWPNESIGLLDIMVSKFLV